MNYIGLLPPAWVERFQSQLAALLESAVVHGRGECGVADIFALVEEGRMHLLVEIAAGQIRTVLALEPVRYPRQTTLNVAYGAGRGVKKLLPEAIEVARAIGACAIETKTRPEVARLYRRAGFETPYVVSRLEL